MGKQSVFDSYIAAAMEYDIFAGGDPSMPASKRFTTETAKQADQDAVEEKEAIDNGEQPVPPQQRDDLNSSDGNAEGDMDGDFDEGSDDGGMGEDDGMDGEGDSGGEEDPNAMGADDAGTNPDPAAELNKKRKVVLYKMTISLHNAITSHLDAMSNITPPSDEHSSEIFFQIQDHLTSAKDILYDIATYDIGKSEYADLLRRVTAITKVYELSLAAIDKLFPKLDLNDKKKKGKRS